MLKSRLGFVRAASLRAAPITQLMVVAVLALGIGMGGHAWQKTVGGETAIGTAVSAAMQSAPGRAVATAHASISASVNRALVPAYNSTREGELEEGETFAELLNNSGASEADATSAMNALSKVYDLRRLQAGQNVTLSFTRSAQSDILTGAAFQPEATKEVSVARTAQGTFTANVKLIPVVRQRVATRGEIRSSLYEAGDRAGVPHAVMASLIRIYSHDIDFQRDIHAGDSFELLYDQPTTAQGKAVGEGEIIYAALNVGGKMRPIYRVMFSDRTVDYFDDKGQSIRRALLRTPVAAAHITSGFGMRMHPLLGYSKMHKGVDFGAPTGTPIFAAGNGSIAEIGFKNGYGRYIRIRHNGQLATAYAHMSRFGSSMYQGAHVNQGDVIGYVGMSGRATGPHLHFEVLVNNNQVNPMSVNLPTGRNLTGKLLADFHSGQGRVKQEFASLVAKKAAPLPPAKPGVIQASTSSTYARPITTVSPSCGLRGC